MAKAAADWIIGVDVGGTKIAAGAVDPVRGQVAYRREIAALAGRGAEAVFTDVSTLVEAVVADLNRDSRIARGVGIGVPELVDAEGRIRSAYLLDWTSQPFARRFEAVGPVVFASDVRAAAAAEARYGAGLPYHLWVYVSVGTGISSTLVQDGVPLAGARGGAVVLSTAPISVPCSSSGDWTEFVLEDYASGHALANRYRAESGREIESAQQVVLAAARGDRDAIAVIESAARALGSAVAWLVNVLDPEAVIVGGGLGLAGGQFWDCLEQSTRSHIWNREARDLPVLPAALGGDAGLIGAALAARSPTKCHPDEGGSLASARNDRSIKVKGGTAN